MTLVCLHLYLQLPGVAPLSLLAVLEWVPAVPELALAMGWV